jgi:hypothetical protein
MHTVMAQYQTSGVQRDPNCYEKQGQKPNLSIYNNKNPRGAFCASDEIHHSI